MTKIAPLLLIPTVTLGLFAGTASAGWVVVDCRADPDSLQPAIDAAAPGDTLLVRGGCLGNFVVAKDLHLVGIGHWPKLDGEANGTVLTVATGATVHLEGLSVTNGDSSAFDSAGGILNDGDLRILRCHIYDNVVREFGGSAINNRFSGQLELIESTVVGNRSEHDLSRGAVFNQDSAGMEIRRTHVVRNQGGFGGGICSEDQAVLALHAVHVAGNTGRRSGGIFNQNESVLDMAYTTVLWNEGEEAGGIFNQDDTRLTMHRCEVSWNTATEEQGSRAAGGILNQNTAILELRFCLVSHNTVGDASDLGQAAGGILNRNTGQTRLDATRVVGNTAGANGVGGVSQVGTLALSEVTLFRSAVLFNHGGEVGGVFGQVLPVTLLSTIVTANFPSNCSGLVDGPGCF